MINRIRRIRWARFSILFLVPNVAFSGAAYLTEAPQLIGFLNSVVLALAVGVCIGFVQPVWEVLFSDREIDRADWLSLGIMCAWFSIVLSRAWSMTWRLLGQPLWFADTDFTSYTIYMMAWAGVFHLVTPGAIHDRVPPARWLRIGIWVAGAMLAAVSMGYLFDLQPLRDLGLPSRY